MEDADLRVAEAFDLLMGPAECNYAKKTAMSKRHTKSR